MTEQERENSLGFLIMQNNNPKFLSELGKDGIEVITLIKGAVESMGKKYHQPYDVMLKTIFSIMLAEVLK